MSDAGSPPGQLWGRQTELAIDNFRISDRRVPLGVVHALAAIKAEAAVVGGLDPTIATAIGAAAASIERGEHDDQFPLDVFQTGSGTSTNMNVNEVIATIASRSLGQTVHPNDHVNIGQSSNDAFPTAVAIAAQVAVRRRLLPSVTTLQVSLEGAAQRFATVVKPGRTHLMDAVPIFLGDEFGGYAAQVAEAGERLVACLPRLGRVPLGGTAVGTGLNAPVGFADAVIARLATRCDIELTRAPNAFAAQGARDSLVELSAQLRGLAVALLKIANDVRLLASGPSTGIGEIHLPELQAGSSIMPGKVNPVMCEMVAQVAVHVFGLDAAVAFAGSQGHLELNTYQPMMAADLLEAVHLLDRACSEFATRCVDGIEADVEHSRALAERTTATAAALNSLLGYDRAAVLVHRAVDERRSLLDVVLEEVERIGDIDPDAVRSALDVDAAARGNR